MYAIALPALADDSRATAHEVTVKLENVPNLNMAPRPPVTEEQVKQIKGLIAQLATIERPDFGLSDTMSGDAFAPLADQFHTGACLLTDHKLERSEALKALVAIGPDALPYLLAALDDQTPTKLVMKHESPFGGMWFADELPLNPVNPAEQVVYQARSANRQEKEEEVQSYTVKVGDVCFVAIGQIVGREYRAVRYQPTACIVLNSPTHDANFCDEVRAIWGAKDSRSKLFDSLRADYATQGVFNGKSLDGWDMGNRLQCSAALRLLFYFAQESAALVAERLGRLDVGKDDDLDASMRRCIANGVRADDFIKAVAWTQSPEVRRTLTDIFRQAGDIDAMLAALPAVQDKKLIRNRLEQALVSLDDAELGSYGRGFQILLGLGQRTPETVQAVFARYSQNVRRDRAHTVCLVLRQFKSDWDVEVLRPLLADTRRSGGSYAVDPEKDQPRRPMRICDEAAVTLNMNHPELKFTLSGEPIDLDKQITAIQLQLAHKK